MWFSWVCVSTWVGGGDEERGGNGGDGGGEIVSWALRFTFSSLSHHMFASCCCFKASKPAFVFFYSCSICSRISHMIDVLARVERADELGSSFLVDTILWPRRIFLGPTVAPNVPVEFQQGLTELSDPLLLSGISDLQCWSGGRYLQRDSEEHVNGALRCLCVYNWDE